MSRVAIRGALALAIVAPFAVFARGTAARAVAVPAPVETSRPVAGAAMQTVVLAGGCFWGIEAVYQHIKGVTEAVSGYAGGTKAQADYETVSSGTTVFG